MIKLGGATDISRGNSNDPFQSQQTAKPIPQTEREREQQQLEALKRELEEAISKSQALEPFKDQLLLDLTPEGLRIQIVDKQNRPMFDMGSAALKPYTREILRELSQFINHVPNRISITGHTDTTAYNAVHGYSNWELSADRANAARRALLDGGMTEEKVTRVVGLSSSVLFDKAQPDNPIKPPHQHRGDDQGGRSGGPGRCRTGSRVVAHHRRRRHPRRTGASGDALTGGRSGVGQSCGPVGGPHGRSVRATFG